MTVSSLGNNAVKLAKTPLGIIALFVLLAEAIAAFVVNSSTLIPLNQTLLVIFITLFPVVVVGMFWNLVVNHNVKLYSPSEFPNHADFLTANMVDPTRVIEQFKNDMISEIENSKNGAPPSLTRGNIELQASEYVRAMEFVETHSLSKEEIHALATLNNENLPNEEAEKRFGEKVMQRLKTLGLIEAVGGASSAAAITELARFLIRIF